MGKRQSPMGLSQTPLGHWIIAVFLAAGVGWGVHAWLSQRAAQSAQTATLSWDPAVARQVEPDLANAAEPAVAMAESILTDSVVASLAQSASLPSSTSTVRIGEFRSRLELRQSSAQVLEVQFRDPDSDRAARIANSVAGTLAAKTSAPASAATAVAPPHPVEKAAPASVKAPVVSPASDASDTLVHSLSELETELSATQQKLDSGAPGQRRERGGESPGYREAKQQQLLTAQVSAALKEVTTLRADPTNSGAARSRCGRFRRRFSLFGRPAAPSKGREVGRISGDSMRPESMPADCVRNEPSSPMPLKSSRKSKGQCNGCNRFRRTNRRHQRHRFLSRLPP